MIYNTKSHKLQNVLKNVCKVLSLDGFAPLVFRLMFHLQFEWLFFLGDHLSFGLGQWGFWRYAVFCAKSRTVLGKSGWLATLYIFCIIYLESTDSVINFNNLLYTLNYKKRGESRRLSIMKVLRFLFILKCFIVPLIHKQPSIVPHIIIMFTPINQTSLDSS